MEPGQFITGRFEGARECHMKPSTFWYQLSLLRRLGNLDIQSDNRNSLVTVIKWLQYQSTSEKSDSDFDNQLTASGQPIDTDNNVTIKQCNNVVREHLAAFENLWKEYPNRCGKKDAFRHFTATVRIPKDLENFRRAMKNYLSSGNVKNGFVKNGSTWFNQWQDWIEPSETMMKGNPDAKRKGNYNFDPSKYPTLRGKTPDA
jgi:hypothetical protein